MVHTQNHRPVPTKLAFLDVPLQVNEKLQRRGV